MRFQVYRRRVENVISPVYAPRPGSVEAMQHPRWVLPLCTAVTVLALAGCGTAPALPEPTPGDPLGPTLPVEPVEPIEPSTPAPAPVGLALPTKCPAVAEAVSLSGLRLATLEVGAGAGVQCTYVGDGDPFDAHRLLIGVEDQSSAPGVGSAVTGIGDWAEYIQNPDFTELWVGVGPQALHVIARPAQPSGTLVAWAEALLAQ